MHPNAATITKFYTAFSKLDADTMAQCYANDAIFEDEVFTLRGKEEVMGMWRMLTDATRSKGMDAWKLEFSGIEADASEGRAHWGGGKPIGLSPRVKSRGKLASQMVIEDRR